MMKNLKKLATLGLAATMLLGSSLTVFAAGNEQTATGSGSYEGYADTVSAFSVKVPTAESQQFDFFVDPNGLLAATGYKKLGDGITAANFEEGSTLFFTRSTEDGTKKYGKDSKVITLTNYSSYAVNVEVSATVTGVDDIDLSESATLTDVTNPTLYLGIVSGSDTKAITTSGGTLKTTIAGEPNNFELKYEGGKYVYGLKGTTSEDSPTTPWQTTDFNLTGACGGTWTDDESGIAPVITLTYKVTDPKADAAPSIATTSYTYDRSADLSIPVSLGGGALAATDIKSVETGTTSDGAFTAAAKGTAWDYDAGTLTFKSGQYAKAAAGDKRYMKVIFNDTASTSVVIELTLQ